jgi:hypothetical protein
MESTLTQHCEDVEMTVKSPPRNRTVRPQEEMRSEAYFRARKIDAEGGSVSVSLRQPQIDQMHACCASLSRAEQESVCAGVRVCAPAQC